MPGYEEFIQGIVFKIEKQENSDIMMGDYKKRMRNYDDDF